MMKWCSWFILVVALLTTVGAGAMSTRYPDDTYVQLACWAASLTSLVIIGALHLSVTCGLGRSKTGFQKKVRERPNSPPTRRVRSSKCSSGGCCGKHRPTARSSVVAGLQAVRDCAAIIKDAEEPASEELTMTKARVEPRVGLVDPSVYGRHQDYVALLNADGEKPDQVLTCAFCGKEYPPGTPGSQHVLLAEHIFRCPEHPVREDLLHLVVAAIGALPPKGKRDDVGLKGAILVTELKRLSDKYNFAPEGLR